MIGSPDERSELSAAEGIDQLITQPRQQIDNPMTSRIIPKPVSPALDVATILNWAGYQAHQGEISAISGRDRCQHLLVWHSANSIGLSGRNAHYLRKSGQTLVLYRPDTDGDEVLGSATIAGTSR
jgi:hypothetical protein